MIRYAKNHNLKEILGSRSITEEELAELLTLNFEKDNLYEYLH